MHVGWRRQRTCAQVDAGTPGCMYVSAGKCFGKRKAEKVTWEIGKGVGAFSFFVCATWQVRS